MNFQTTHFGAVALDESSTIDFPAGLPGFEDCRRFAVLQHPAAPALSFVQSLEHAGLCFLALPVLAVRPEYQLAMAEEDLELLGMTSGSKPLIGENVLAFAILSLVEGEPATANLLSPVVIHLSSRRAVQAIRPDSAYECREPLATEEPVCS
jgi:flagellar assembly factor FliW